MSDTAFLLKIFFWIVQLNVNSTDFFIKINALFPEKWATASLKKHSLNVKDGK